MTHATPCTGERTYTVTRSDCAALRSRLQELQAEYTAPRHIHMLCFAGYLGRTLPGGGEDHVDERFALHYYQNDPSYVFLQRDGTPDTAILTEEECRALLSGETDWLLARHNPLLRRFHQELTEGMLLPQVLFSYDQEIYSFPQRGIRFTLDTALQTAMQHMDFLDPSRLEEELTDHENSIFLRVTGNLPDDIHCLIREAAPRRRHLALPYLPV